MDQVSSIRSRRAQVLALVACMALASLLVGLSGSDAATTRANAATRSTDIRVDSRRGHAVNASSDASSASATAVSNFAVFGAPAQALDALPTGSAYSGGIAMRIAGTAQSFSAWGVLDGSQMCVTVDASSGPGAGGPAACNSVAELTQPGQLLVLGAGTGDNQVAQILVGLVPNGVSAVTVSYKNGTKAVVPVNNNGFAVATGGLMPDHYSWATATGNTETESAGM